MGMFSKKKNAEMSDRNLLGNTEFVFDRKLGFHVGEWTVWDRKTKILLEFQSTEGNIGDIVLEKVTWVNDHKDMKQESASDFARTTWAITKLGMLRILTFLCPLSWLHQPDSLF